MNLSLYLKSDSFQSSKDLANYFRSELIKKGLEVSVPIDNDYMFSFQTQIKDKTVCFYMGKNDEQCSPPLWQIWPEQKVPFFERIFGKPDRHAEDYAKVLLEEIAQNINGVDGVEWAI